MAHTVLRSSAPPSNILSQLSISQSLLPMQYLNTVVRVTSFRACTVIICHTEVQEAALALSSK